MAITRIVTICNKKGLHARAAAKFVKCAQEFQADITVKRRHPPSQQALMDDQDQTVSARSILGLMMLGVHSGIEVELFADGPDESAALDAIQFLIENRFDEGE